MNLGVSTVKKRYISYPDQSVLENIESCKN